MQYFAVVCDISKAIDMVWHRGLLHKLSALGISGSLLRWFSSYLSSRQQRVLYAGSSSSWSSINGGVPQGSILGPLLFLVHINNITTDINANIRVFADDTSLYIVVGHPDTACTVPPYSTAISRQSTPGPRYCLHRTQQRSPDSLLLVLDMACILQPSPVPVHVIFEKP